MRDPISDDMLAKAERLSARAFCPPCEDKRQIVEAVVIPSPELIAPEHEGMVEECPLSFWDRIETVEDGREEIRVPVKHLLPISLHCHITIARMGERMPLTGERRLGEAEAERVDCARALERGDSCQVAGEGLRDEISLAVSDIPEVLLRVDLDYLPWASRVAEERLLNHQRETTFKVPEGLDMAPKALSVF